MSVAAPAIKAKTKRNPPKAEILPDAFYAVSELTTKGSPHYLISMATLFLWIKKGLITPRRVGRRIYIKGSSIHELMNG